MTAAELREVMRLEMIMATKLAERGPAAVSTFWEASSWYAATGETCSFSESEDLTVGGAWVVEVNGVMDAILHIQADYERAVAYAGFVGGTVRWCSKDEWEAMWLPKWEAMWSPKK